MPNENYERLMQYAFHILSRKRYTVKEMRQKLAQYVKAMLKNDSIQGNKELATEAYAAIRRGESDAVDVELGVYQHGPRRKKLIENDGLEGAKLVNEGVLRLSELGYLNDQSYTRDYLAQRVKLRPRGKMVLKRELAMKGIDEAIIEKGLEECEIDEFEMAKAVLLKKTKAWSKYDARKQKSKAYAFLASKGFERDAIYRVMESCYYNNASWD